MSEEEYREQQRYNEYLERQREEENAYERLLERTNHAVDGFLLCHNNLEDTVHGYEIDIDALGFYCMQRLGLSLREDNE